jgi:hypothetical protein
MLIYQCSECGVEVRDGSPLAADRCVRLCCVCLRHPGWMTDPRLFSLLQFTRCNPCHGGLLDRPPIPIKPRKPSGVR